MVDPGNLFVGLDAPPQILPPEKKSDWRRIYVNFQRHSDVEAFARCVNRPITGKTKELHFPPHQGSTYAIMFQADEGAFYEEPPQRKQQVHDDLNTDLFDYDYEPGFYEQHWVGMPLFEQPDSAAVRKITCWFKTEDDVKQFADTIDQKIGIKTPSIWFPYRAKNNVSDLYWISTI